MDYSVYGSYLIVAVLLVGVIWRQISPRVISKKTTLYLVIMLIGVAEVGGAISTQAIPFTGENIVIIAVAYLILAVPFGIMRAKSYRLWVANDGLVMRRGTVVTVVLWMISFAIHLGIDYYVVPGSDAFLILYLGLSLMIQREWVFSRAKRLYPNEIRVNLAKMAGNGRTDLATAPTPIGSPRSPPIERK